MNKQMSWLDWLPKWLRDLLNPKPKPPPPNPPPGPPPADGDVAELLRLHNAERTSRGLSALRLDARLTLAAQKHCNWMSSTGTFSHTGENGSWFDARCRAEGYSMSAGSENIALGQRSPTEAVESWMSSSGHRANILSDQWDDVGFGRTGNYWCADFGVQGTRSLSGAWAFDAPEPLKKA